MEVTRADAKIRVSDTRLDGGTSGGELGIEFTHHNTDVTKTAIVAKGLYSWKRADLHFILDDAADDFSYALGTNTKMIIKNNGNVGVGTTNPSAKLHVESGKVHGSKTSFPKPAAYTDADLVLGSNTDTRNGYGGTNGSHIMLRSSDKSTITALDEGNNLGQISYQNLKWTIGENIGLGAQTLQFPAYTNGVLKVDGSGNVGVASGADVPAGSNNYIQNQSASDQGANFRVNGTGVIGPNSGGVGSSRLKISNSATDFADFRFSGSGMGQLEFVGWSSGWNINTMTANKNLHINRDAPSTSNLLLGRFGLETFISGTSGNVGVGGVTNPQILIDAKLDQIIGTSATSGLQHDVSNRGTKVSFGSTSGEFAGMRILVGAGTNGCGNTADIRFDTWECNTATTREVMRITGRGNVGIGTTAPASVFHVVTNQVGNVSKLQNPSLPNGSLVGHEFGKTNSTNNMAEFRYNHISDDNAGNYVNLGLWGSANTLNIVGTGNVGVGTTAPGGKLHVSAGEGDGIVLGSPNDPMGFNGGSTSIKFYGYRDVVSNAIGAKISAERTDRCCGYLSQGTELAFYTNDGLTTSNADNSVERVRITDSGTLQAKAGLRTERQIRFYKRSRGNGQGGVDNLGNYDFCYLAGVAFRNSDSVSDEDDDYQCNVYSEDINGSAQYNEGQNQDYTTNFSYSTRPYWKLYSECYQDCSNSTCTAMCINFDY